MNYRLYKDILLDMDIYYRYRLYSILRYVIISYRVLNYNIDKYHRIYGRVRLYISVEYMI